MYTIIDTSYAVSGIRKVNITTHVTYNFLKYYINSVLCHMRNPEIFLFSLNDESRICIDQLYSIFILVSI